MFQTLLIFLEVLAASLILYGLWEMRRGRLTRRSGGSGASTVAAGVSKVLNGVAAVVLILLYTGVAWRLGHAGPTVAAAVYLMLLGLSLFIRRRFGQPGASSEGS